MSKTKIPEFLSTKHVVTCLVLSTFDPDQVDIETERVFEVEGETPHDAYSFLVNTAVEVVLETLGIPIGEMSDEYAELIDHVWQRLGDDYFQFDASEWEEINSDGSEETSDCEHVGSPCLLCGGES